MSQGSGEEPVLSAEDATIIRNALLLYEEDLLDRINQEPEWFRDDMSRRIKRCRVLHDLVGRILDPYIPERTDKEILAAVEEWEAEQRPTMSQEEFAAMISQTASPEDIQRRRADARIILKGGGEPSRLESQGPDVTAPPVGKAGGVRPPALSAAEMAKRAPLPPDVLADAHQGSVHIESGIGRPAKSVKVRLPPADEFRAGLPPLALRKVWPRWVDQDREVIEFRAGDVLYARWTDPEVRDPSDKVNDGWFTPNPDRWLNQSLRPETASLSAIELLAAKALGEDDGKAGANERCVPADTNNSQWGWLTRNYQTYLDAYTAAKGTT